MCVIITNISENNATKSLFLLIYNQEATYGTIISEAAGNIRIP